MEPKINNFQLKSISEEKAPYLDRYNEIERYLIYRSNFNESYFTIYDEEFEVYRVIEYSGMDPRQLDSDLEIYINYYKDLADESKQSLTV